MAEIAKPLYSLSEKDTDVNELKLNNYHLKI